MSNRCQAKVYGLLLFRQFDPYFCHWSSLCSEFLSGLWCGQCIVQYRPQICCLVWPIFCTVFFCLVNVCMTWATDLLFGLAQCFLVWSVFCTWATDSLFGLDSLLHSVFLSGRCFVQHGPQSCCLVWTVFCTVFLSGQCCVQHQRQIYCLVCLVFCTVFS